MNASILDTIDIVVLGRNLQEARKKRGLTQEDAAKIIQVARTTMTAIEKGERRIKPGELIKLSQAYGRQVSDFVRERPAIQPFRVQLRGPLALANEDTDRIAQPIDELEELCRNYLELENITAAPLVRNYPAEYQISGLPPEQAGERIAVQERNRLGLGDGPLSILREILEEDVGLRVFYLPLTPSKFSEIYFYNDELGGCIAVNSLPPPPREGLPPLPRGGLHPEERRRWSLARGYAHFLANRYTPVVTAYEGYERLPGSERFADSFAQNFLMPTEGLKRRFYDRYLGKGRVTPADLCILAHYYGVSVEALTRRLEDLRLLSSGTWERLRASEFKIRAAQQELGLDRIPTQADKLPQRYQHLAFRAFHQGLISEGQFARFLSLSRMQSRRAAELLSQNTTMMLSDVDLDVALA